MTLPVRLSVEAVAELDDAATWYDEKRVGLGGEFMDAVEEAVEAIVRWPRSGSLVDGVPADLQVRRLPVMRFPYHLAYAVDDDQVRILAIAHDRQRPEYWAPRTDG